MDPDRHEIRALGCLIEKQRTTPDAYPLTLNALRLACNQSTNRHWTRSTSWAGRATSSAPSRPRPRTA